MASNNEKDLQVGDVFKVVGESERTAVITEIDDQGVHTMFIYGEGETSIDKGGPRQEIRPGQGGTAPLSRIGEVVRHMSPEEIKATEELGRENHRKLLQRLGIEPTNY